MRKQSRNTWKDYERRVARRLGGKRIPVTGERDGADVIVEGSFCIQCKNRGSQPPPDYLVDWVKGIERAAKSRDKSELGIVVWKAKGQDDIDSMVVMHLDTWESVVFPSVDNTPRLHLVHVDFYGEDRLVGVFTTHAAASAAAQRIRDNPNVTGSVSVRPCPLNELFETSSFQSGGY